MITKFKHITFILMIWSGIPLYLFSQEEIQVKLVFSGSERKDPSKHYIYGSGGKDSTDFRPLYDRYYLKPQYKVLEGGPPVFSPGKDMFVRYENAGTEWRMIIRNTSDGSLFQNIPQAIDRESSPHWFNDSIRIFFQHEKNGTTTDFSYINVHDFPYTGKFLGSVHNQYYSTTFGQSPAFLSKYDSSIFFTKVLTSPAGAIVPAFYDIQKNTEIVLLTPGTSCNFNGTGIPKAQFSSLREPNSVSVNTQISISPVEKKIAVAGHIKIDENNDGTYDQTRMGLFIVDYLDNPVSIRQIYNPIKGPYSDWPGGYYFSPDGKKVVFNVDMGLNDFRIYISDVRTGTSNELVKGIISSPFPWSSDGSKIVYSYSNAFFTISSDGTGITQVTPGNITDSIKISDVQFIDYTYIDANGILKVETVDPFPELIINKKLSTNETDLADKGKLVSGITAEGVSRVLVRAKTDKPSKVTFSIKEFSGLSGKTEEDGGFISLTGETPANEIVVNTVNVNNENWAFAVFLSPLDFVRTKFENIDKNAVTRKIEFKISNEKSEKKVNLNIFRPPLVFVHGLWSSKACWDDFYPLASPDGSHDPRFTSYFADYNGSNDKEIIVNTPKVLEMVKNVLTDYREKNDIACSSADLIVHSMGGLISRAMAVYTQNQYFSDENFGKGYIHKLITMDTPHDGAEICDFLYDAYTSIRSGTKTRIILQPILHFIGGAASYDGIGSGAVYDMIPGSTTLNLINKSENVQYEAPCHRFACFAGWGARAVFNSLIIPLQYYLLRPTYGLDGIFMTPYHDLCVTVKSQRGSISEFTPSSKTDRDEFIHFSAPGFTSALSKDSRHGYFVIDLLNSKRNTPLFSDNGRNISNKIFDVPLAVNEIERSNLNFKTNENQILINDTLLEIKSPAKGMDIKAGDKVSVTVEPIPGVILKKVWLASLGYSEVDSVLPFSFNMPTYVESKPGPFEFSVFAEDSDGNIFVDKSGRLLVNKSYVNVSLSQQVIYLTAGEPKRITIKSLYDKMNIRAMGLLQDSTWVDLTQDKNIFITSLNSSICGINNGILMPIADGKTKIILKYLAFSDTLNVDVDLSYQEPIPIAGDDLFVKTGEKVNLDASKSIFQQGMNIFYTWKLLSVPKGSFAVINNTNSPQANIIPDKEGSYSISLSIEDSKNIINFDVVNIYASKPNEVEVISDDSSIRINILNNKLSIDYSLSNEEILDIQIFNVIGNFIRSYDLKSCNLIDGGPSIVLPIVDTQPGLYFCRIKTNKRYYLKKVILLN